GGDAVVTRVVPPGAAVSGANVAAGWGAAREGTAITASVPLSAGTTPTAIFCSREASSAGVLVSSGVNSRPRRRIQRPALERLVSLVSGTDRISPDRIGISHQM